MSIKLFTNADFNVQSFSAQGAVLKYITEAVSGATIPGGQGPVSNSNDVPLLVMGLTMSYTRRVQKLYPVNVKANTIEQINVLATPQGQLTISNIYSPDHAALVEFLSAVGKDCKQDTYNFWLDPFGLKCDKASGNYQDAASGKGYRIELKGVELEQLQFDIQGGDSAMINQPLTFSFNTAVWHKK